MKKILFKLLCFIFVFYSLPVNCQSSEYNYSIKNRWTIKASIARYKTHFQGSAFMYVGDFFDASLNRRMTNFKVEANYGINKFIEVGIFTGFQHYEWSNDEVYRNSSLAPLFGVTTNFHVLPFFLKSKSCHWDLYLTARYGGCYLPHKEYDSPLFPYSKYRHEYGLGLGIGYYIKNIIGFYVEGSVGQFALFQSQYILSVTNFQFLKIKTDGAESNFSFRIGIAAKINR